MPVLITLIFNASGYCSSADGRFPTAKLLVPECLDSCPLITIRRFFQKAWRYMDAYRYAHNHRIALHRLDNMTSRKGLNARQAAFANKRYKSHRRVGLPHDIVQSMDTQDA